MGNGYAYDIITGIPNVVIAALLIFAGLKLLGLHPEKKTATTSCRRIRMNNALPSPLGKVSRSAG